MPVPPGSAAPSRPRCRRTTRRGYTDVAANRAPAGTKLRKVDAYQTFDLQPSYNGIKSTRLALGVKNLTDRDPRGRYAYASATCSWK
jgi:iron complex outermembrane receptor protein